MRVKKDEWKDILMKGEYDDVRDAIKGGSNVNYQFKDNGVVLQTPLTIAAERVKYNVMRLLLKNGARVDDVNYRGETALFYAVRRGTFYEVNLLIENGTNVNHKNSSGITPLVDSDVKETEVIKLLVENGANINDYDEEGNNVLVRAIHRRESSTISYLLEYDYLQEDLNKGLIKACYKNLTEYYVDKLLEKGADINCYEKSSGRRNLDIRMLHGTGGSPLVIAAYSGSLNLVKFLVDRGAKINLKNKINQPAIVMAALAGYKVIVDYLLNQSEIIIDWDNLLLAAAEGGLLETVKLALNKGANINSKSNYSTIPLGIISYDKTPLMNASTVFHVMKFEKSLHFEIVKLLVESGANINDADTKGMTALDWAEKFENTKIYNYLKEKGALSGKDLEKPNNQIEE